MDLQLRYCTIQNIPKTPIPLQLASAGSIANTATIRNSINTKEVLIIGDSNTKGLTSGKFSHKIRTEIVSSAFTCNDAKELMAARSRKTYSAVVLHVGTNHVKQNTATTDDITTQMCSTIDSALNTFKDTKIVVSQIPPSDIKEVDLKVVAVNSQLQHFYQNNKCVSFAQNYQLKTKTATGYKFLKDAYHVSDSGTKVLAASIKNAVKDAFYNNNVE